MPIQENDISGNTGKEENSENIGDQKSTGKLLGLDQEQNSKISREQKPTITAGDNISDIRSAGENEKAKEALAIEKMSIMLEEKVKVSMGKILLDDLNVIKKLSKDQQMKCIRILRNNANQSLYWDSIMLLYSSEN